jgi:hypothetical protein
VIWNSLGFSLLFLTAFPLLGVALVSLSVGALLRSCYSEKKAGGGAAGASGGAAGASGGAAGGGTITYHGSPFLMTMADNANAATKAYNAASANAAKAYNDLHQANIATNTTLPQVPEVRTADLFANNPNGAKGILPSLYKK